MAGIFAFETRNPASRPALIHCGTTIVPAHIRRCAIVV
jgi:hypothetical protein